MSLLTKNLTLTVNNVGHCSSLHWSENAGIVEAIPELFHDLASRLVNEYRFKTKGEMLVQCADQALLTTYACDTTSCGRFRTYNRKHCGRCVPCMVRKAAIQQWGLSDTTRYKFSALSGAGKTSADDPMAVACAVLAAEQRGIDSFLAATLTFASDADRPHYRRVAEQGLAAALLRRDGVL